MRYRRVKQKGGSFFFTLVTYHRQKIFERDEIVEKLRTAFRYVLNKHPVTIDAVVVLPDHLHCIWTLPEGDTDYSMRWRLIKSSFSRQMHAARYLPLPKSYGAKQESGIWQRRFWEHTLRDEEDFIRHVEYIHYNPVKHGLAAAPIDWPYSSFHRYVEQGLYEPRWGSEKSLVFNDAIGME